MENQKVDTFLKAEDIRYYFLMRLKVVVLNILNFILAGS